MTISAALQRACDRATAAADSGAMRARELSARVTTLTAEREAAAESPDEDAPEDDEPTVPEHSIHRPQ